VVRCGRRRPKQAHGLATTAKIVSHTGVAELILWRRLADVQTRPHGRHLLAVDVVTADGGLLRWSEAV
jgi:hypothetical protein